MDKTKSIDPVQLAARQENDPLRARIPWRHVMTPLDRLSDSSQNGAAIRHVYCHSPGWGVGEESGEVDQ